MPQKDNTGLNRHGAVDELAALVSFVAGPEAAYITGANLTVDGGTNACMTLAKDLSTNVLVLQKPPIEIPLCISEGVHGVTRHHDKVPQLTKQN